MLEFFTALMPERMYLSCFVELCIIAASYSTLSGAAKRIIKAGAPTSGLLMLTSLCLLLSCLIWLEANPFAVSDALEYITVAKRWEREGTTTLPLNGEDYPSRYLPWFSIFFLSLPAALKGANFYYLIVEQVSVFFLLLATGLSCLLFAPAKGFAAILAVGLAAAVPELFYFSSTILTDVPAAALVSLISLGCLLLLRHEDRASAGATGFLLGMLVAVRPVNALVVIPLVMWTLFKRRQLFVQLLTPSAIIFLCSLILNHHFYGEALRTGYHAWLPLPYESLEMTFSLKNSEANILYLSQSSFAFLFLLYLAALVLRKNDFLKDERIFRIVSLCGLLAVTSLYLTYFYYSPRFFLPLLSSLLVTISLSAAMMVRPRYLLFAACMCLTATLVRVSLKTLSYDEPPDQPVEQARRVVRCLPNKSIFIGGLNPLLYEDVFLGADREMIFIPVSRSVEFASKAYAEKRVVLSSEALSLAPLDHRHPLVRALPGVRDVYPEVALEISPRELAQETYVDLFSLSAADYRALEERLTISLLPSPCNFIGKVLPR